MRSVRLLALLALVVVLLRRWRSRADPAPIEPAPTAGTLPPAPPEPRFLSVPWTLVEAPADRPELVVRYEVDEHMTLDRVDAQETDTQVFVTVLAHWHPPSGGWFAPTSEHDATVALQRPLGERALVHAPVDVHES